MSCLLLFTFAAFLVAGYFVSVAGGGEAKILLESVDDNKTIYNLNQDILEKISQLQGPIRVIAAVGNARVGKSTTLNLISHIWNGKNENSVVEEIFKTGDSYEPVTHDVWAHIINAKNENGNIVFLDVEGTNIGDDSVTDRLSMFTAMMSSALNVFVSKFMGNGDTTFLYRIARLSKLVFEDKNIQSNFPTLRVVMRTSLDRPSNDKIRDDIFKRENGQIIEKYFPRSTVEVSYIPNINDLSQLKDLKKLNKSDWGEFQSLANNLQNSPEKRSLKGSIFDGATFKQLAEKVVVAMNSDDSWKNFGDVYATFERDICRRSYEKHITPVLRQSSKEIEDEMLDALDAFEEDCVLENEITNARKNLKDTLNAKRKREDEDRRKQEEEDRRRADEENRRRKEENYYWETLKAWVPPLATFVGGYMFSDQNLKYNVTTMPYSEYKDIGLRGVCWKWNEDAKKSFGLTGEACGVIAQEVKILYPRAVSQGNDGYLRVQYNMLREMIYDVRNKSLSLCM